MIRAHIVAFILLSSCLFPIAAVEIPACNDKNPCTDDSVDPKTGACVFTRDDANDCTDGDPCTVDVCVTGQCTSYPAQCPESLLPCDDGNPCTTDTGTVEGGCIHTTLPNGSACDASLCADNETCTNGVCGNGYVDPNACPYHHSTFCNQVFCDTSVGGTCQHATPNCDDGQACTTDYCFTEAGSGCGHVLNCQSDCEVPDFGLLADKRHFYFGHPLLACDPQPASVGTSYRIVRGSLAKLPVGSALAFETCIPQWTYEDPSNPPLGQGYWYVIRMSNRETPVHMRAYTYGREGRLGVPYTERATSTCPAY